MISYTVRTYKGCFFANVLSVFSTIVDVILKLIALCLFFGMIGEIGLPGVLAGFLFAAVCIAVGTLSQKLIWRACDRIAAKA